MEDFRRFRIVIKNPSKSYYSKLLRANLVIECDSVATCKICANLCKNILKFFYKEGVIYPFLLPKSGYTYALVRGEFASLRYPSAGVVFLIFHHRNNPP